MIKLRYIFLVNLLFFSTSVYSKTEVLPPEGPFKSNLRQTFNLDNIEEVTTIKAHHQSYEFKVPDLGRYQEGAVFQEPEYNIEQPSNNTHVPPVMNRFNGLKYQNSGVKERISNYSKSFDNRSLNQPKNKTISNKMNIIPNATFDSLPIANINRQDSASYPPEWGFTINPQGNNQTQSNFNNVNQRQFNTHQGIQKNNPMLGMPFTPPLTRWQMNDNSNLESRK